MPRHTEEAAESFNRSQLETVEEKEKPSSAKFKKGMKLEMVDPINLNAITVGTIVKVFSRSTFCRLTLLLDTGLVLEIFVCSLVKLERSCRLPG